MIKIKGSRILAEISRTALIVLVPVVLIYAAVFFSIGRINKVYTEDSGKKWHRLISRVAMRAAGSIDKNLSIDDQFASELYLIPSIFDGVELFLLVDPQGNPIFSVGESETAGGFIGPSDTPTPSGSGRPEAAVDSVSGREVYTAPVVRDGEIIATGMLVVRKAAPLANLSGSLGSSVPKIGIPFLIWVAAVWSIEYYRRRKRSKYEAGLLTELRLSMMGYKFVDVGKMAQGMLTILASMFNLDEGFIFLQDKVTGEIRMVARHSTSGTSSESSRTHFDPADPRLVAMAEKSACIYALDKLGQIHPVEKPGKSKDALRVILPLVVGDQPIGLLEMTTKPGAAAGEDLMNQCTRYSDTMAASLETILTLTEYERQLAELSESLDMVEMIDTSQDLPTAMGNVTRKIMDTRNVRFCRIFGVDEEGTNLVLLAETWRGEGAPNISQDQIQKIDEMPMHKVAMLSGQSQVIKAEDIESHTGSRKDIYRPNMGGCIILIIPLILGDRPMGCLSIGVDRYREFPQPLKTRFETLAGYLSASFSKARACEKLKQFIEDLGQAQDKRIRHERLSAAIDLSRGVLANLNRALISFLELLGKMRGSGAADGSALESAEREIEEYSIMVRRFGKFINIEKDQDRKQLELAQMIGEIKNELTHKVKLIAGDKNRIELDIVVTGSGQIYGDRASLMQMIRELVINAAEATPDGGRVLIETRVELNLAVLEVTDQGRGMTDDVKGRIFEPFFTTKEGSERGLGLSIVYGVVTSHDGTIDVISEPDNGTRVLVKFPLVDPEQTALFNTRRGTTKGIPLSTP